MANSMNMQKMTVRDLIDYENMCTMMMKYAENNRESKDFGDLEPEAVYRIAGNARADVYKEMLKRLLDDTANI